MQILGLVWGILAVVGMIVGFFPCLGALNWINIPLAGIGIIVNGIALGTAGDKPKGASLAGLICCIVATLFGLIRLFLGAGVL